MKKRYISFVLAALLILSVFALSTPKVHAASAMKSSEQLLEIIKQDTKAVPVLLLDDVLSELDDQRKLKLLKFCSKAQTLLTCTEFNFNIDANKIKICAGSVQK